MLNFFKKQSKRDSSNMAQLSEEDIQKKLYGTYKPGTLGRVIKVSDEALEETARGHQHDGLEQDLFSDMNSLGVSSDTKSVPVVDDASEEIITEQEDLEIVQKPDVKTIKTKAESVQPIVNDEDLLQIDFGKEEDTLFLKPVDRFASVKVTLEEMWDKLRGMGLKFFIISGGLLVGIILGFNIISSYVQHGKDEEVVVINEKRQVAPPLAEKATVSKPMAVTAPAEAREVLKQSVVLPSIKVTPSSSADQSVVAPRSVAGVAEYTVQICVSNKADASQALVADLKDAGFDAFYSKHTTKTGRDLFFIYVGQFAKQEDAAVAMKHYRTVPKLKNYNDSFVTKIKEQ